MLRRVGGHIVCNQLDELEHVASVASLVHAQQHLQTLLQELQVVGLMKY